MLEVSVHSALARGIGPHHYPKSIDAQIHKEVANKLNKAAGFYLSLFGIPFKTEIRE